MDTAQFLKDFAEELYYRAASAKSRDERMAIKGVQHSLERALLKHNPATAFARPPACPVSGCGFEPGQPYAGRHPCQQNWAGDPQAHKDHLRGCALGR
jgi:hypothetical protein